MKRCPECRRDYYDDSLLYCLDDGSALLEGPGGPADQTAVLEHIPRASAESGTLLYNGAPETLAQPLPAETHTERRSMARWLIVPLVIFIALIAGGVGGYFYMGGARVPATFSSSGKLNIKRLTSSGKIGTAAISPDGRYVAYVLEMGEKQSIHLLQVNTGSDVEIVPPTDAAVRSPNFSRDGEYVYYTQHVKNFGTLYQVASLGGTPRQIHSDIDSGAAISPDGKTMAFVHEYGTSEDGGTEIMLMDTGGSNVRSITKLSGSDRIFMEGYTPAWSSDGKSLACSILYTGTVNGYESKLARVDIGDGSIQPISDSVWNLIDGLVWLKDGALIVSGALRTGTSEFALRLWLQRPGSAPEGLTTDLSLYRGASLTADGASLLTTQMQETAALWVSPLNDSTRASRIMQETAYFYGQSWTPDGRIMFVSTAGGADIWTINPDGTNKRRLTSGCGCDSPVMTPDGRYIVYMRYETPADGIMRFGHVFRMDANGGNQQQITNGPGEMAPLISKDGKWVIYRQLGENNTDALWRAPVEGGPSVQLTFARIAYGATVSPADGSIAYMWLDPNNQYAPMISVVGPDGGEPLRTFRSPTEKLSWLRFTPDGRSIAYGGKNYNEPNVWLIPADGKGAPKQLTNFKDESIFGPVAWSPDGKQLAAVRGTYTSDAVLLTGPK